MELFYARSLAQAAPLAAIPRHSATMPEPAVWPMPSRRPCACLDFRLQQIALTLDADTPDQALELLTQLWPAVRHHPRQVSEWHALNGLALYRTQQMKEAILELKTALSPQAERAGFHPSTLQCGRLLMTLGNPMRDLNLYREAETYYQGCPRPDGAAQRTQQPGHHPGQHGHNAVQISTFLTNYS